jgi:hypothetical protein
MLYNKYVSLHLIYINIKFYDHSVIGLKNIEIFINYAIFNFLKFNTLNLNQNKY